MQGANQYDSKENNDQPQFCYQKNSAFENGTYRYVRGALKWAYVKRGSTLVFGWVCCYPDGEPITYADANVGGSIQVSCSGTYITS
jgi:hypothetical protein